MAVLKRFSNLPIALPGIGGTTQALSKSVFNKYDTSNSGFISGGDFGFLCEDMGHKLSPQELAVAIKLLDHSGDGKISYDEFSKWWKSDSRFSNLQKSDAELVNLQESIATFQSFDKDHKGTICKEEFKPLHEHLVAIGVTDKTLENCLKDLDTDNNGVISFNEYVEWIARVGTLKPKA
eukprot:TRINITY_DN7763_c0_g1_i1.p1 TRINITY_DN7763_c0_g1~~TRINITY_DN7763_c0_g1_i1.p1  ORF type:complete len:179 (+),score=85.43 TRINITY_DN7763_c0_g1_i1:31-567(+)